MIVGMTLQQAMIVGLIFRNLWLSGWYFSRPKV